MSSPEGENTLSYLQAVYHSPTQSVRIRCAVKALPYEQAKLSAVAVGYLTGDDFGARLARAIARSAQVAPKLIETPGDAG